MINDLILGTAGHIDHGKTSLIGALTGTNTDRLPEEKKRGITIELGYAFLSLDPYRIGIVDVPGHEKFVRQMLAGATGIDLSLLVVAANDSVKQQTYEHLDILRILDLPAGVIAITKSDLVEPDWLEMVQEEIREVVQDTFLADAPMIATSAKTGEGIDELKQAIGQAADIASRSNRRLRINAPFKMAIDRAFTIEGHGTVVTGSVSSGTAHTGDVLEIQPGNKQARIRSVQNHDHSAESVHRGQRAAINLTGVQLDDVQRGHEVAGVGHLVPTQLVTVELYMLKSVMKPLRDRKKVRFHVGTAELLGTVKLLDKDEVNAGEKAMAQIYLSEPAVCTWNQPFVLRRESPVFTIGGGRILDPNASKIKNPTSTDLGMLGQLSGTDEMERAVAAAYFHSNDGWDASELPRTAGVFETETIRDQLLNSGDLLELKLTASRNFLIEKQRFLQFCEQVLATLAKMHAEFPLRFKHAKSELESRFSYLEPKEILQAAIKQLRSEKKIELNESSIGLVGSGPKLSKGERNLLEQLCAELKSADLKPPTLKEILSGTKKNKDSVPELLRLASENGNLIPVSKEFYFHKDAIDSVKEILRDKLAGSDGLTMSDIRQILDSSRKFTVPLCEYLDSVGFTVRDGDVRRLASVQK